MALVNSAPNVQPSPRFPLDELLALYVRLSGVGVTLESRKQPFKGNIPSTERAWIEVDVGNFDAIGDDEMRAMVGANGVNTFKLRGERKMSMTLKAKSLDNTLSPWSLLERIRFRLKTDLAANIYRAAGVSLASSTAAMAIRHYNETIEVQGEDSRTIRVAVMELKWNWCASAVLSPTDQDTGEIDTVNGGSPTKKVGEIPIGLT